MQTRIDISIAHQCPYQGGPSVFQARAILQMMDTLIVYEDAWVCQQAGYRKGANLNSSDPIQDALVYPNPARDEVSVRLIGTSTTATAIITIRDVTGRLVFTGQLAASNPSLLISTLNWLPGMYLVQVECGSFQKNLKLSIIR